MKKCSECQETKELTEFFKNKKSPDGLEYKCKSCKYQRTKKWYKNNLSRTIELNKKWKYKIAGVYAIFEKGECLYVGESKRVLDRFTDHKSGINNPKGKHKTLYNHLTQHKHIIFGVLEETPNHKEREQYWINKLKPKYNATQVQ